MMLHIFCMPEQLDEEFKKVIDLVLYVFSSLGFDDFTAQVSFAILKNQKNILDYRKLGISRTSNHQCSQRKKLRLRYRNRRSCFLWSQIGFYGQRCFGRQWQLGTIQVDYNLPERFDLTYKGSDNETSPTRHDSPSTLWKYGAFCCYSFGTYRWKFSLWLMPNK